MAKTTDTKQSTNLNGFTRVREAKVSLEAQYAERVESWDDATVDHCLDMIDEGRMRVPFKIRVVQAAAVKRGLATADG